MSARCGKKSEDWREIWSPEQVCMPDLWTRLRGEHGQINGYRSVWLMRGGGGNRGECLVSLIYGETVYRSISPCSIVKSTRCPVWVIGNSWLVDRARHTKPNPQGQKPPPTAYNTPTPRVKNPQPHGHIHHRDYIPPPISKYIPPLPWDWTVDIYFSYKHLILRRTFHVYSPTFTHTPTFEGAATPLR